MNRGGVVAAAGVVAAICYAAIPVASVPAAEPCPNESVRRETNSLQLPDCRAYELASLAGPYDAEFTGGSPDGHTIFFASSGGIGGLPPDQNTGGSSARVFGATRSPLGWSLSAATNFTGLTYHTYQFMGSSFDGSRMFVTSTTNQSPEGVFPVRALNLYETLSTASALLVSHDETGGELTGVGSMGLVGPVVVSADGSHVVFSSGAPLTALAASSGGGPYVYEADPAGNVSLVSVMSNGELPPGGAGAGLGSAKPGELTGQAIVTNAISADGATVFFTSSDQYDLSAPAGTGTQLFMHRDGATVDVSNGTENASYDGASEDGSKMVFTDGSHNMYAFDTTTRTLVPISSGAGELNEFLTMSADGSHVYFASNLQLDPAGPPANAGNPGEGFLYEFVNDHVKYITTLSQDDVGRLTSRIGVAPPEETSDDQPGTQALGPIRATPDGKHLAFESERRLTADDSNEQAGRVNVYEYTDGEGLVRVSQGSLPGTGNGPYNATIGSWQQRPDFAPGDAATVQERNPFTFGVSQTDGRVLTDDSSVFFSSREALAPGATDGPLHVYEWSKGRTYLISPAGPQASDAHYLDNSPDGANVYFSTTQAVLPNDTYGGWVNIWDARVRGGFSGPSTQLCEDNECPVAPPSARGAPLSMIFSGPGNPTPATTRGSAPAKPRHLTRAQQLAKALRHCRTERAKRKRRTCERRARMRYGTTAKQIKGRAKGVNGARH